MGVQDGGLKKVTLSGLSIIGSWRAADSLETFSTSCSEWNIEEMFKNKYIKLRKTCKDAVNAKELEKKLEFRSTSVVAWLSIFRHFSRLHWQFSPHVIFPLRHLHCLLPQRPLQAHWGTEITVMNCVLMQTLIQIEIVHNVYLSLTPIAFAFLETLRPFSALSGRHSSSSFSPSLEDIRSKTSMAAFTDALAVVLRLPLGFRW